MENNNITAYLKRVSIFLEDESWEEADAYCEKVLDIEPECAEAYLGKLLAEFKVHNIDELSLANRKLDESKHYKKILKYADDALSVKITEISKKISEKISKQIMQKNSERIYNEVSACQSSNDESIILSCIQKLEGIAGYKDADEKKEFFKQKHNEITYSKGVDAFNKAVTKNDFEYAAEYFRKIENYKDSAQKLNDCLNCDAEVMYRNAVRLKNTAVTEEDYNKAIKEFDNLGSYKDSYEMSKECHNKIKEISFNATVGKIHNKNMSKGFVKGIVILVIIAAIICIFSFIELPREILYKILILIFRLS